MLDLANQNFGRLTALEPTDKRKGSSVVWRCICNCGKEVFTSALNLRSGGTKSCGCLQREGVAARMNKYGSKQSRTVNKLYYNYQRSAKIRGLDFGLTLNDFIDFIKQPCTYCGNILNTIEVSIGSNNNVKLRCNGIDRIDNTKGYTIVNCTACCSKCNYAKGSMTTQEYIDLCKRVADYNK